MRYVNYLGYLAIILAFVVHYWLGAGKSWEPTATFFLAGMGVIPLAALMGTSTEHLSQKAGPTWGGLLNATFGNAAELIIGVIALMQGLNPLVKASLTGSILGNLLLVGGGAMVVGGWKRQTQKFSPSAAETGAGMLALAVAAMLFPAIFYATAAGMHDPGLKMHEHEVSFGTSLVLIAVYALGLLFTLKTHKNIFTTHQARNGGEGAGRDDEGWTVRRSIIMLLIAAVAIGFVSELLVGSAEQMAHRLGWNEIFIGVVLLATIGNAAEHSTAVLLAHRGDMETAMTITWQSSLQIALFATPFLVLLSALLAYLNLGDAQFMDLMFSPMEVVAVILAVFIVSVLGRNGETNWFEGTMLLGLYAIIAVALFFIPAMG